MDALELPNCELVAISTISAALPLPESLVLLDLSQNRIESIDGLDKFVGLRSLVLHHNRVCSH